MSDYIMKVIPEPEKGTATVFVQEKKEPFFKSGGENNYLCGKCKFTLCENIRRGQITNTVFKCPNCGSYNTI
jgi:uncharacterized ferredoxin-like protein